MNKFKTIASLVISLFVLCACNKKPELISIKVYDPFYDRGVEGAQVTLVAIKGNTQTHEYNCDPIKYIATDSEGQGFIKDAKFRKNEKFTYILKVSRAYDADVKSAGICGIRAEDAELPKTDGTVDVQLLYVAPFQTGWAIKITNLKTNGFGKAPDDSIAVKIFDDFGYVEGWDNQYQGSQFNGSKREAAAFSLKMFPGLVTEEVAKFPESAYYPMHYGKHKVSVRKRKGGIVRDTTYTETVRHDEFIHEFVVKW